MMLASVGVSGNGWDPRTVLADADPATEVGSNGRWIAEPERRLLFAILTDALIRFRRLATSRRPHTRHDLLEAERWLRSDNRSWPCSFLNICDALEIAPEPLRRAVLKWRKKEIAKRVTRRGLLVRDKAKAADSL
jgi:hypothetical protein